MSAAGTEPRQPLSGPVPVRQLLAPLRQDPFLLSAFLSLLLIGADILAIRSGGLTLRVAFPVLMAAMAFLYLKHQDRIYFDKGLTFCFMALAIAGAASIPGSYDATKSIGYTVWVLFDFFVIVTLAYNLARRLEPVTLLSIWFLIYRIHVGLLFCEIAFNLAHGSIGRPRVWFYESSFLAIFMMGYFGAALYMFLRHGRRWGFDFALSLIGLLGTTSSTGMFGMIFAVILNFFLARQRLKLLIYSAGIATLFAGLTYLAFRDTVYYQIAFGFLMQKEFTLDVLLDRSGNRVVRALVGWDAFQHFPWTGVGIGGDQAYMNGNSYPELAWRYVHPWTDLEGGQPFSNIIIEVLGTMGLVGFVPFAALILFAVYTAIRAARNSNPTSTIAVAIFIGFFSTFLALQFESTFLRYYLWSPLGLAFGLYAQLRHGNTAPPDRDPQLA